MKAAAKPAAKAKKAPKTIKKMADKKPVVTVGAKAKSPVKAATKSKPKANATKAPKTIKKMADKKPVAKAVKAAPKAKAVKAAAKTKKH